MCKRFVSEIQTGFEKDAIAISRSIKDAELIGEIKKLFPVFCYFTSPTYANRTLPFAFTTSSHYALVFLCSFSHFLLHIMFFF